MSPSPVPERPQKPAGGVPSRPTPAVNPAVPSRPVPVNPGFPSRPASNNNRTQPGKGGDGRGKKPGAGSQFPKREKKPVQQGGRKPPLWLWIVFGAVVVGALAAAVWFVVGLFGTNNEPAPVPTETSAVAGITPIVTGVDENDQFLMVGMGDLGLWTFMPEYVSEDMTVAVTDPAALMDIDGSGECAAATFLKLSNEGSFQEAADAYMEQYLIDTGSSTVLTDVPVEEVAVSTHTNGTLPAYQYTVPGESAQYQYPQVVLLVQDPEASTGLMGFQVSCTTPEALNTTVQGVLDNDPSYGLTFGTFTP